MTDFRFQEPLWLLLWLPLVILTRQLIARRRRRAVVFSDVRLVAALPVTRALRVKRWLPWIRAAGTGLVILALARPQLGEEDFRLRAEGIAIQMCLDRSGSMQTADFTSDGERISRLEAVRRVFRDFVLGKGRLGGRPNDLIGLMAFGGFPENKCPLTLDHEALLESLDTVYVARPPSDPVGRSIAQRFLAEESATALGDAVALAVDHLRQVVAKSRVIVLLSDGRQTAGVVQPDEAASAARAYGVRIYAIGVGSARMASLPARDSFGRTTYVPRNVELDEPTLRLMARVSGGRYFHARDAQTLEDVYAEIDRLEKTASEGRAYSQYRELYFVPTLLGGLLIVLEITLTATRFRPML